jgi:hypothetical protein
MKVKIKGTGQTVLIDDNNFDPNLFEKVDDTPMPTGQQGVSGGTMQDGGLNISPQQAMLAQILMPGKQADMVKSAYDIQLQSQALTDKQEEKAKKEADAKSSLKGFVEVANELKQGAKDISVLNAPFMALGQKLGVETSLGEFERKRAITGQFLAKMVESGRLSDKDREFYLSKIMNITPYGPQEGKEQAIDSILRDVVRLAGEDPESLGVGVKEDKKKETTDSGNPSINFLNTAANAAGPLGPMYADMLTGDKNVAQYGRNALQDTKELGQGIAQLPQLLQQMLSGEVAPLDVGKQAVTGMAQSYGSLAANPSERAYEKPVTSLLDVLGLIPAAKGISALDDIGRSGKGASMVDDATRLASKADDVTKAPQITSLVDDVAKVDPSIQRIMSKADDVGVNTGPSQLSRNIYQSAFPMSKKNKAFERLKPNETVATMIEHNITGTPDQILVKTEKVSGRNGMLSNVVNEAIADTKAITTMEDMGRIQAVVNDAKKSGYAYLTDADFNQITKQLNGFPQGEKMGNVDLSLLLDYERKLQKEAMNHRINSVKGDVRSAELAELKFTVAEEIGNVIDSKVTSSGVIDRYKDPALIEKISTEVSPVLAEEFKNAKTISDIRRLQRDYVRMNQILELSLQESSALGKDYFRVLSQVPVVGKMADAAANQLAVPLTTKASIGLESTMRSNPYMKKLFGR